MTEDPIDPMGNKSSVDEWNWGRTHKFAATRLDHPTSIEQLQHVVAEAARSGRTIRSVGSRHSFSGIADASVLVDLGQMPERFGMAVDRSSAVVNAAMTYSRLAELLGPAHRAVANLASLPHLSIAGATATATHGSGNNNGNLATSTRAVEVIDSTGEHRLIVRGDPDFQAAAVSLGALGIIVAVELDLVPNFEVRQHVHNSLGWDMLDRGFEDLFASAYSVSAFTDWIDHLQLWTKERIDDDPVDHVALHNGVPATEPHHPVPGHSAFACTQQAGVPGSWDQRLPHFRAGAVPSTGAEAQSEFFVPRQHAAEAIRAIRGIGALLAPHLMVSEIRTVRADDLWLSPQYERDCVAFHFTWQHNIRAAHESARLVTTALAPFDPVPHWGKVFDPSQFDFHALYPQLQQAQRVFADSDPNGTFDNRWMNETFGIWPRHRA